MEDADPMDTEVDNPEVRRSLRNVSRKSLQKTSVSSPPVTSEQLAKCKYEGKSLKDFISTKAPQTIVEVSIPQEYMTIMTDPLVSRQLWGTSVYTDDSDVLAVLLHMGYINPSLLDNIASEISEIIVQLKVLPVQEAYPCKNINTVRSRSWLSSFAEWEKRCSYTVASCKAQLVSGDEVKLHPSSETYAAPAVTFVPAATEKIVNTRSSASSIERKHRFVREVSLQYNLCNEPWLKYIMTSIADQGLQPSQWTSARLHNEVIFAESRNVRYQLSLNSPNETAPPEDKAENGHKDLFSWSICKTVCPMSEMRKIGIPFSSEHLETLENNLEWEQLKWTPEGVFVNSKFFPLSRIHFMPRQSPNQS